MLFGPPNSDNEMTDLESFSMEVRKPKENTVGSLCRFLFLDNVVDRMSQAQEGQVDLLSKELLEETPTEIKNYFEDLSTTQLSEVPPITHSL